MVLTEEPLVCIKAGVFKEDTLTAFDAKHDLKTKHKAENLSKNSKSPKYCHGVTTKSLDVEEILRIPSKGQQQQQQQPCFKVQATKAKGQGMFATRSILPGEIILREKPLIVMPDKVFSHNDQDYIEGWLDKRLNKLSASDREIFFKLSDSRNDENNKTALGIFYTNDMSYTHESAALFPTMARANHACSPNADFVTRPQLDVQDLVAVKKIEAGDEVTISYMPASAEGSNVTSVRQDYTKTWYGFECQCTLCLNKVMS